MNQVKNCILKLIVVLTVIVCIGCGEENTQIIGADGIEDFSGNWLLNEHGYSPGDRYITEPVSPVPSQVVRFNTDGTMSSNIAGMAELRFYELAFDEQMQKHYVIVYKTADELAAKPNPKHSYTIDFADGQLRLSYRFCIEGCHMKFEKFEQTPTND